MRYYYGALKDGRLAGANAEEVIQVLTANTATKDPQVYRTTVPNGIDPDGKINVETLKEDWNVYNQMGWIQGGATVDQVIDMLGMMIYCKAFQKNLKFGKLISNMKV